MGCDPIAAGPSGLARCKKESASAILLYSTRLNAENST